MKTICSSSDPKKALDGLEILLKLLQNIVNKPTDDKYRQIKGTIPKIGSTLFSLTGANLLLLHMNFEEIEPSVYIYLDSDVSLLHHAVDLIQRELQPIRQSFMSKEDRDKAILLE